MSQGETLLVVHNPYALELDASGAVSEASLVYVSYWLDHFLRPEGERRRALDAIYYKRKRYDGRIIVVLTNTIDWTQPRYRAQLERGLGAHAWRKIVKERYQRANYADATSLVFEFDQTRFTGKRDHVEHFGYTAVFDVPRKVDDYQRDNVQDKAMPIVLWQSYPPASWSAIPRMNELLERPIQRTEGDTPTVLLSSTLAPTPGPDKTSPTVFKTDPYKDDPTFLRPGDDEPTPLDLKPAIKREPGAKIEKQDDDVKPRFKREVKFEDDVDVEPTFKRKPEPGPAHAATLNADDLKPTIVKSESDVNREYTDYHRRQEGNDMRKRVKNEEPDLFRPKRVKREECD